MAVDPRNFLLNTDYEMDKIIYFLNGDITTSQHSVITSHGLGFAPLLFGVCANNSSFSDARPLPSINDDIELFANSTDVYLYYNGIGNKIYYRIYGMEPSNSNADIPPTSSHANSFILNTDYNYCKLHSKGIATGSNPTTITHGLGYVPQVLAWAEKSNGGIYPIENNRWNDPMFNSPYGIAVGSNTITIKPDWDWIKTHYRIYYDEA